MDKIIMAHGSGGRNTKELIDNIFASEFSNSVLNEMEDSAVVDGNKKISMTTDSFVVTPNKFKGGDIGKLAVCGTVNDLLMRGSVPKYLTCGFIITTGTKISDLKEYAHSMKVTCDEAGVNIVAGDTKVIEGNGEIFINTAGVGFIDDNVEISSHNCECGDVIIVSGNMGDHHAALLSERMNIQNEIVSDCAPLNDMVFNLLNSDVNIKTMRDVTRGGLATVLKEISDASSKELTIYENKIPVNESVKSFAKILGLDPLYMGNEGKMVCVVASEDAEKALDIIKKSKYGENAEIIGEVTSGNTPALLLKNKIGAIRSLDILQGEGLPRIC